MSEQPITATQAAPQWFTQALAAPKEDRTVEVEGATVHYVRWGDAAKPGLLLVHGGAAHAGWWDFLAPLFADRYHVVAVDLSGHGESAWRAEYPREIWARELIAVTTDARFVGAPIVVGHSMGGLVTIVTASLYGDKLAGAVIVDSPVRRSDPESEERRADPGRARPNRIYPSLEVALGRFRLMPPQPCENAYIIDHIARTSLKEIRITEADLPRVKGDARVGDPGWTWKFDPRIFMRASLAPMSDYLASVRCRVALIRGDFSAVVPPETGEYMYELLERNAPLVEIPQAYHHLMLDQPLAFVTAVRALLADWEHSVPRKRV